MTKRLLTITFAAFLLSGAALGCASPPSAGPAADSQRLHDADAVILVKGIT